MFPPWVISLITLFLKLGKRFHCNVRSSGSSRSRCERSRLDRVRHDGLPSSLGFRHVSTDLAKLSWPLDQATFPLRPFFKGCCLIPEAVDLAAGHLCRLAL